MSDSENKRTRRTTEERIAEVEAKIEELNKQIQNMEEKKQEAVTTYNGRIAKVMDRIKALEKQKAAILAPKPPRKPRKTKKEKIQDLMKQAQKAGLKPEEIAERLGLTIQDWWNRRPLKEKASEHRSKWRYSLAFILIKKVFMRATLLSW